MQNSGWGGIQRSHLMESSLAMTRNRNAAIVVRRPSRLAGAGSRASTPAARHSMTARRLRIGRLSGLVLAAVFFSSQIALAQFTQQGPKLVGTGAMWASNQGGSVALSADGNTAIVGGP